MRVLMSASEHERHRAELERLRNGRDLELQDLLRDARTYVASDAVEEILQIEEDDAVLQSRITRLQQLLDDAEIVPDDAAEDVVALGRSVDVEYVRSGRHKTFVLVGTVEPGVAGAVSASSPVGQALMGRTAGEVVTALLPVGRAEDLLILAVGGGSCDVADAA
jgi:transcription elongation factor GreA